MSRFVLPFVCAIVSLASWQAFHGEMFPEIPEPALFIAAVFILLSGWRLAHRDGWSGFFVLLAWFAGASAFIPSMYVSFTGGSFWAGAAWYVLFCLLAASPALIVPNRYGMFRLPLALLLHASSPIGAFSPLLALLALFPGLGFLALFLAVAMSFVAGVKGRGTALALGTAVLLGAVMNAAYRPPQLPSDVWGISTFDGPQPAATPDWVARQDRLVRKVLTDAADGARLIVLPEATVDRPGLLNMIRWVNATAKLHGRTRLIVGVTHSGENYLLDMESGNKYYSTMPMVVGLWHPWNSENHYPMRIAALFDLIDTGDHGRVPYLICYEETLIYPLAAKMLAAGRPKFVISASNQWFSGNAPGAKRAQNRSILINSRAWDVPVLRAVNGPSS